MAEIYLLGILGDTGNFAYLKPHQSKTLLIAKRLIEIGKIEIQEFQSRYRTLSDRVFTLIQELIKNTRYHQINNWPNFQTSYLDRQFRKSGDYIDSEVSEASHIYMAHYLRVIKDHPWGFVVTPKDNGDCGMSLRSLPNGVSVRDIVEKMGIGGGHDRAAGSTFKKKDTDTVKVKDCMKQVMEWMKKNKPVVV